MNDSIIRHSPANGHLSEYQEAITQKYFNSILNIEKTAKNLSSECQKQLSVLFSEYKKLEQEQKLKLDSVLESMSTTQIPFEELSQKVSETGENLINESISLYKHSLELYDESFSKLQPVLNQSYEDCKDIIPQIEPQYADKMDEKVEALNTSFLESKTKIVSLLESFVANAKRIKKEAEEEFLKRTGDWRTNRFEKIVTEAKARLNPIHQLEYGTLFDDFYNEQTKFKRCFVKDLQSFTIIMPPDHFEIKDVTDWWEHVDEMLKLHSNFINIYIEKITNHLNEKTTAGSNLLQEVQKELSTLKDATEVSAAISELTPLQKHTQKLNQVFIEKLTKYLEYQKTNLRKAFESLRDFLMGIAERYAKFLKDADDSFNEVQKKIDAEEEKSNKELTKLEANFTEKEGEIALLANEKDITQRVKQCQIILQSIEKEYRNFYEKAVAILDDEPNETKNIFDASELDLLTLLKLRKTVFAPEFANIIKPSNSKSRLSSVRKQIIRPKKAQRPNKAQAADLFAFTVSNGAKFEEIEPLKLIPDFEEFTDEPTTITTNKKGGRPKPTPKKPTKPAKTPSKGRNMKKSTSEEALDDFDIPEFNFISSIPKINDKLAIDIYIPQNAELIQWSGEIRKQIISTVNDIFGSMIIKSQYKEQRNDLANQLNERMRTHAPRLNALDLNIAKTRVIQIESRKMQLEKHFHHAAITFNKGLLIIENNIDKYKDSMFDEIGQLSPFIQNILEIRAVPQFVLLEQNFKLTEKRFLANYDEAKKSINDEIDNFIKAFEQTNDRFIDTVVKQDASYSEEERTVAMEYFNKMKTQVNDIINALKEKIVQASIQIDNKYQSIADEFQTQVPKNIVDVTFTETLLIQQNQAKSKYDTLIFRNKQQEQEIDKLIEALENALAIKDEPQQVIILEFESLERLRIALIKRAKYLSLLKSDISHDPIGFNIDLSTTLNTPEHENSLQSPNDKKKNKARQKSLPNKAKLNLTQKKPSEQDILGTMQGQIDQIGSNLINSATKTVNDYFENLKKTKTVIARTKEIPPNPNDNIQNVKNIWMKTIEESSKIFENSGIKFRSQIARSITLTREATTLIYDNFGQYYYQNSVSSHQRLKEDIEEKLEKERLQWEINKKMLTPKIADPNNIKALKDLVKNELDREKEEKESIDAFESSVIESERGVMNQFTTHIPMITTSLMSLFDKFPLFEDLVDGPTESKERKSLKELLKTKERKASSLPEDPDRPFHCKQWPTLPYVMEPMTTIVPPPTPEPVTNSKTSIATLKKKIKKKEKEPIKTLEIESMPPITTIDTQLHRGVIVERNNAFELYQNELKNRIAEFQRNVETMKDETAKFANYWKSAVKALCPNFIFPKNK